MEIRRMLAGANHYYQGTDILDKVGEEAGEKHWKRALVLGGSKALEAAWPAVENGLRKRNVDAFVQGYGGFNTAEDIDTYAALYAQENCSGIIGIGGGKIMDLAKAVGAAAGAPVFTVPTSAATCAAVRTAPSWNLRHQALAMSGMSSRCSRRGGARSGTTVSR